MKKFLSCTVAGLVAAFSMFIPAAAASSTYTNSLASAGNLADWTAYYAPAAGSSNQESLSKHWAFSNGGITRVNDISGQATSNIAILTLKKYLFTNFELTVTYQKTGSNWPWAVVAFRQSFPGKYFLDDGAGVFVQDDGESTIWGGAQVSGPFAGAKHSAYQPSASNTLKIKLVGANLTVTVNGTVYQTYAFSNSTFNSTSGYISLEAVDNTITFKNLSITNLDSSGKAIPLVGAGSTTTATTTTTAAASDQTVAAASTADSNAVASTEVSSEQGTDSMVDLTPSSQASISSESSSGADLGDLETEASPNGTGSLVTWILSAIIALLVLGNGGFYLWYFKLRKMKK